MTRKTRVVFGVILCAFPFLFPIDSSTQAADFYRPTYPRLANYYLVGEIDRQDIAYFSGWDLQIFNWYVDRKEENRRNLSAIKRVNGHTIFLIYHIATGVNTTVSPPDPLETAADDYYWWLQDYHGNLLTDQAPWEYIQLINFTNTEAAAGSHPDGERANEFLPEILIDDHLDRYAYWDGVFYDVFSDNIQWLHLDIKDATVNWIPEFDTTQNGDEPIFNDLWRFGMTSLAANTLALGYAPIIVGNGLNRNTTTYLNGRMLECYRRSGNDLSDLSSVYKYSVDTLRDRPIGIVDGVMEDPNFSDFRSLRFSLVSALLVDAYFSSGTPCNQRAQALWFDEYAVKPNARVAAVTTRLIRDAGETDEILLVSSTNGFPRSGVVTIDGEQIYYTLKTDNSFRGCLRGFPRNPNGAARHDMGRTVIHYVRSYTGYLGHPTSEPFDVRHPSVRLWDLFNRAGWFAPQEIADQINSRVWGRFYQNGFVLLNPSTKAVTVRGLGSLGLKKIDGIQDPDHNDGKRVGDRLVVDAKDGYILMR